MENTNVRSKKIGLRVALEALFKSKKEEKVNEKEVEKFNSYLEDIVLSDEDKERANTYRVDGGFVPEKNGQEKVKQDEDRNKGLER